MATLTSHTRRTVGAANLLARRAFSTGIAPIRADRRLTIKSYGATQPSKVLAHYAENADLDLASLLETLRTLGKSKNGVLDGGSNALIVEDERFPLLLNSVQQKIPGADARSLTLAIDAVAKFRHRTPALDDFTLLLAEETKKRPNAFSPRYLSQAALGFSARQLTEPELIEFIRAESLKVCQDIEPSQAIGLLEAFRRWGLFDRELVDVLIERMTDEVG